MLQPTINTVRVGDDTDCLVLLCYHANVDNYGLFFKARGKEELSVEYESGER